jgi:hypothetical protein
MLLKSVVIKKKDLGSLTLIFYYFTDKYCDTAFGGLFFCQI